MEWYHVHGLIRGRLDRDIAGVMSSSKVTMVIVVRLRALLAAVRHDAEWALANVGHDKRH